MSAHIALALHTPSLGGTCFVGVLMFWKGVPYSVAHTLIFGGVCWTIKYTVTVISYLRKEYC